ncbi:MAG: MarR family transcriptional regulator [Bryobacterales bacterium]|nr:MarR family transcriptional regulator [Bryobacterales bacterium]
MTDTVESRSNPRLPPVTAKQGSVRHLLGTVRMLSGAVAETVERQLQRDLAGHRLSAPQWKLLTILATSDVGNVSDVAAYQGVSTAAASKAVQRLARMKLVTRMEDPRDRRHVRLALSEEGARLATTYLQRLDRLLAELPIPAGSEKLEAIGQLLDQITVAVLRTSADPSAICIQCASNGRAQCLIREAFQQDCHLKHRESSSGPARAVSETGPAPLRAVSSAIA